MLNLIDSKTLRAKVYEQLREEIVTGRILPGQELSLRSLSQQLGVSLMPIREAVWQLESEKILIVSSNRNIRVNFLSSMEMEEALRLRYMLESEALKRSCDRHPESVIFELKNILEEMHSATEEPRLYITLNNKFHSTMYSYADSPLLLEIIRRLWVRVGPYFYIHVTKIEDLKSTIQFHYMMLEAFSQKKKKQLIEALHKDLQNPAEFIIKKLKSNDD